jgi:hypothetical protein
MKTKRIIVLLVMAILILSACSSGENAVKNQESIEPTSSIGISFIDLVEPGSVWILTDTEKNRKTSVWGTAMLKPEEIGEEYIADIPEAEDGRYLFRMIDDDGIYYETDIPELKNGWKVIISRAGLEAQLSIYDDEGKLVHSCEVFSAAL